MTNSASNKLNPWLATRTRTGAEYDAPYVERALAGEDIHGEANLVEKLVKAHCAVQPDTPFRVLDGGCGTGRMGIELAQRGFDVVGVDLDEVMLSQARAKAPHLQWHLSDLATIQIDGKFDAIALAGNVMIYLTPNTERAVLTNMAQHLKKGGLFITAFELNPYPWTQLTLTSYEQMAADAGLALLERWSTWDQDPWKSADTYVVSVCQKQ